MKKGNIKDFLDKWGLPMYVDFKDLLDDFYEETYDLAYNVGYDDGYSEGFKTGYKRKEEGG
jgi:hypothetical protein